MGRNKPLFLLIAVIGVDFFLAMVLIGGLSMGMFFETSGVRRTSTGGEYMEPKNIALTFDDGPNKNYTERLLDGLKERDVKASFFLVGDCIEGKEDLVRRMAEDGHLIGVHCMQHTQLTKVETRNAVGQLDETKQIIEGILADMPEKRTVEYVRPPYGAWNEELDEAVREELSLETVFWDVDSLDWKIQNTNEIVQKVVRNTENGDIILMHDEFGTSVEAAFQIIDNMMAKGYTFVTVNELMVD